MNRDPARVIMIDAKEANQERQPENVLRLKEWDGKGDDTTLLDVMEFLKGARKILFVCVSECPCVRVCVCVCAYACVLVRGCDYF